MRKGTTVRLVNTGSPVLEGTLAVVEETTPWGAHVSTSATASGRYRAHHSEMVPLANTNGHAGADVPAARAPSQLPEYTGDECDQCGSLRMRWAGACKVCEDCGASGGCS